MNFLSRLNRFLKLSKFNFVRTSDLYPRGRTVQKFDNLPYSFARFPVSLPRLHKHERSPYTYRLSTNSNQSKEPTHRLHLNDIGEFLARTNNPCNVRRTNHDTSLSSGNGMAFSFGCNETII